MFKAFPVPAPSAWLKCSAALAGKVKRSSARVGSGHRLCSESPGGVREAWPDQVHQTKP